MANPNKSRGMGAGTAISGLLVILIGGLILLFSIDAIEWDIGFSDIFGYLFAGLFMLAGVGIIFGSKFKTWIFPLILIAIGVFMVLARLESDLSRFWPLIIVVAGLAIIVKAFGRRKDNSNDAKPVSPSRDNIATDGEAEVLAEDRLDSSYTFSSQQGRVVSDAFTGGQVNVTMSDVTIDMRDAKISDPPARLKIALTMCQLQLRVPSDWKVQLSVDANLGHSSDNRDRQRDNADAGGDTPDLVITGNITLANLQLLD